MKSAIFLFVTSVCLILASMLGGFTDVVWVLSGRPSESYPELLFAFIYLPTSVLLLVDASVILWRFQNAKKKHLGFKVLWTSALLKLFGLTLTLDIWLNFDLLGRLHWTDFNPLDVLVYVLPACLILSTVGAYLINQRNLRPNAR